MELIEKFTDIVVSIATPYGSGTGFYLYEYDLIVSNHHVIAGVREVIISSNKFKKQITKVLFSDSLYDIAFLEAPKNIEFGKTTLADSSNVQEGEKVIAIGHPYGLKYTVTQGIVSKVNRLHNNINYIQVDAAINPGNSGGPSINQKGEIIGVNTFIIAQGTNLGFALPTNYLKQALEEYQEIRGQNAIRCQSCSIMLTENKIEDGYCNNCGVKVKFVGLNEKDYQPVGISKTIEEIVIELQKDIQLSRIGKNQWEIEEGSAKINISYDDFSGFIFGDAQLCMLPKTDLKPLYEFLLKENFSLEDSFFSLKENTIILSVLIFDQYLNKETGIRIFKNLFEKADHYDNILVDEYGCSWKEEEKVES